MEARRAVLGSDSERLCKCGKIEHENGLKF